MAAVVYAVYMSTPSHSVSVITNHLRYLLEEEAPLPVTANQTTILRQAEHAQHWLMHCYLRDWIGVAQDWVHKRSGSQLQRFQQLQAIVRLACYLGPSGSLLHATKTEKVFFLGSLQGYLRSYLTSTGHYPHDRSLDWGIRAKGVAASVVDAFKESGFLDPVVCDGVAQCVMLLAFLMSQELPEQSAQAEEICGRMFEKKAQELLDDLLELPTSPEA